jgi:hypothetical protein
VEPDWSGEKCHGGCAGRGHFFCSDWQRVSSLLVSEKIINSQFNDVFGELVFF